METGYRKSKTKGHIPLWRGCRGRSSYPPLEGVQGEVFISPFGGGAGGGQN